MSKGGSVLTRLMPAVAACTLFFVPLRAEETAAAPTGVTEPKTPPVYFSGNEWFSVAADRAAAGTYVSSVAERVSTALRKYGFSSGQLRPGSVTVYVNSGNEAPSISLDGGRTLQYLPLARIPGGTTSADLALDRSVARALAASALCRLAQAAGRQPAPKDWIVEALAWESQVAAYPGELEWLTRTASEQGPGTLAQLDAPNKDNLGGHSRAAFILLRSISEKSETETSRVIASAALGRPIAECLGLVEPALNAGDAVSVWWPAAFYREVDRRPSAVASPAVSARRFAELSRFVVWETLPGEKESRDVVLDAEGLIARRADKSLAAHVEGRILEIKHELLRANPVWFNALHDYGLFLEKLPTAPVAELDRLAFDVMAEAKIAKTLTAEVDRALHGGLEAR